MDFRDLHSSAELLAMRNALGRMTCATAPTWVTFDAATRTIRWTPPNTGSWTINVIASGPAGLSVTRNFTLTAVNSVPVYNGTLNNRTAITSNAFSYTMPSTAFTDANNEILSYTEWLTALPSCPY